MTRVLVAPTVVKIFKRANSMQLQADRLTHFTALFYRQLSCYRKSRLDSGLTLTIEFHLDRLRLKVENLASFEDQ